MLVSEWGKNSEHYKHALILGSVTLLIIFCLFVQVHTLYPDLVYCIVVFQARDDILNGSHPVSFDKACEFGGIQAQIQFGPHVEHKHKPGFLE